MTWFQALILGIVEGLTEYLPVSSTGHLILTQRALGIEKGDASDAFAICIQAGAILAVLGIYARRVGEMLQGLVGRNPAGLRLALQLGIAFLPAAILGLAFGKTIKARLFHLQPIAIAWFVGGVVILAFARWRRGRKADDGRNLVDLPYAGAAVIGLLQCLGMIPGTSRSLVTILGGLLVGLNMKSALEFSFLLGLVTLTATTAHDAVKHGGEMLAEYGPLNLAIGFAAATVSAFAAVRWMLSYLQRHSLALFGWYRIGLALVVGWLVI